MIKLIKAILVGIGIAIASAANMAAFPQAEQEEKTVYIDPVFARWGEFVMPSVGEVRIPVFIVEFQDVKFNEEMVSREELDEWIFTGGESVAEYYRISSYDRLHMDGDIFFYTAKGNMSDYESYEDRERLVAEMLDSYDKEIDFTRYDQNGDGTMDALILSVPEGGDSGFWWGATHTWWCMTDYTVDGLRPAKYLVNDDLPYKRSKEYFIGTLEHELGHCMGLPDYYKYEYDGSDYEGFHGAAGNERMDDSAGDFCQFSKLQLGWLTESQVQIMPSDTERASFLLPAVNAGGCLLVFPKGNEPDFQGEYFLIEYNTNEGLQSGLFRNGGVRTFHAQAEMRVDDEGCFYYRYNNYSEEYDTSNEGIRILKLINDGKDFSRTGDVITFENTGGEKGNFGWYTEDGKITDPCFSIHIGEVRGGCIRVEIIWDTV